MWHSFQTLLYFWHVVVVYLYTLAFSHLHEGSSPVLLRSGSHIVNQSGGRSQSQLRPGTVIKLGWAMWKRHRALNALTGDNMSTAQIDHMGSLCLLGMPAALRHCGELCHLVNGERETVWGSQWVVLQYVFLLHTRGRKSGEGNIGSEIAWCLIKMRRRLVWDAWSSLNKHQVSLGFQRKFHAAELYFMVLSLARLWNTILWLLTLDIIYLLTSKYRCK